MPEITWNIDPVQAFLSVVTLFFTVSGTLRLTRKWKEWLSVLVGSFLSGVTILCVVLLISAVSDMFVDSMDPDTEKPSRVLGDVERETEMETRTRTFEFGRRNDHCQGTVDVRWHVKAAEGWDIDVASIKVEPPNATSKSNFDGVADPTKAGFYLTGRVTNSGMCVKVLGEVIARDARGALNVKGTYRETRLVPAQGG